MIYARIVDVSAFYRLFNLFPFISLLKGFFFPPLPLSSLLEYLLVNNFLVLMVIFARILLSLIKISRVFDRRIIVVHRAT